MKHRRRNELRYPGLWCGCVGAWNPGLGPTGLTLRDNSGFGNHGTLTNMDAAGDWITNGGRYALDFDGSNDYVDINPGPIPSSSSALSASLWVNVAETGVTQGFFEVNSNQVTSAVLLLDYTAKDRWRAYVSDVYIAGGTVTVGWHHVVATIANNTSTSPVQVYVDGSLVIDNTRTTSPPSNTPRIRIGGHAFVDNFSGQIDDVRVYNRVLSTQEIRLLASRRGIAYELAPRRRSSALVSLSLSLNLNNLMMGSSF